MSQAIHVELAGGESTGGIDPNRLRVFKRSVQRGPASARHGACFDGLPQSRGRFWTRTVRTERGGTALNAVDSQPHRAGRRGAE
jgi:hypothetical protein